MKKIICCTLMLFSLSVFAANKDESCSHWFSLFKPVCQRLHHIWVDGDTDLYISGYAWHNRYTYRPEKIKSFNELAWGGGLGKGLFGPKHDWQGIYAFALLDSHSNWEPVAGYAYLKVAHFTPNVIAGIGYSVLVTARRDINHGYPFPGAVPWAGIFYKKVSIAATYIPGSAGAGNVLYLVGKYTF